MIGRILVFFVAAAAWLSAQQPATSLPVSLRPPGTTPSSDRLAIVTLYPEATDRAKPFNVQPDGEAAIAIECENATNNTQIVFGGRKLKTARDADLVTAVVPAGLYAKPGRLDVYLVDGEKISKKFTFRVR